MFRSQVVLLLAAAVTLGSATRAQTVAHEGLDVGELFIDDILSNAGFTPLQLEASDVESGALLSNSVDVFVISRGTTFSGASNAYVQAVGDYLAAGGDIVSEWSGVGMFFSSYAPDIRSPAQLTPQLGCFEGAIHAGEFHATGTPIRLLDPLHPTVAGLPNPFSEDGGTEYFMWIESDDPDLTILADFEGNGSFGYPLGQDLPCLAVGCKDDSVFVFGTWCYNDTLGSGGFNDQFLVNAVTYASSFQCRTACFTLDFETEDDFATVLVNGQHLNTEFGTLVSLSSAGLNSGMAIFDSTPGGPNDPSQDLDLLVDTGNILILQTENFPPDGNDVFPRPNDDDDGGTIAFAFPSPVEAQSLKLVDIDATDGMTRVVLLDGAGRERTYSVPANWTGDLLAAGPGQGVLDLTTLLAQPGFASVATALEDVGFDAAGVVRIEVQLSGSAGIDDLSLCASGVALHRASVRVRNGSGVNPLTLLPVSLPVLGETWSVDLDCTAQGRGLASLFVRHLPLAGTMTPFGEALVQGELMHRTAQRQAGTVTRLSWAVPSDMALVGLSAHAQGLCIGGLGGGGRSAHAQASLSNSLDLVLGF